MKKLTLVVALWAITASLYALEVSESSLIEMAKNTKTPSMETIEASFLEASEAASAAADQSQPELYGGFKHRHTNERAMIPFMPIFKDANTYQLGIQKKFKYGLSSAVSVSRDERSGKSIAGQSFRDINTLIYNFNLSFDLWKDLFGRMTKAQLENAELMEQNAQSKKEIEQNSFVVAVRRIYWQLVAINEKLTISEKLHEQAQKQAADAVRRRRSSISDDAEVARYESQVLDRQGTVLVLQYQREILMKQLKNLLPDLKQQDIVLGKYDVEANINSVLECTVVIGSQTSTPLNYTQYDDVLAKLEAMEANQLKIDQAGDDVDLKLVTNFFATGLGSEEKNPNLYQGSFSDAQSDLRDHDRSGWEAGLSFTIPLGTSKKSAAEVRSLYHQKRNKAERANIQANLDNTHSQISRSVALLSQVTQVQTQNSEKLEFRLKEMRAKFSQARISVSELMLDQDAKMSSDLAVVDTRLAVVNVILDYFSIFNQTPCSFNRK